jgi:hypothetical protein
MVRVTRSRPKDSSCHDNRQWCAAHGWRAEAPRQALRRRSQIGDCCFINQLPGGRRGENLACLDGSPGIFHRFADSRFWIVGDGSSRVGFDKRQHGGWVFDLCSRLRPLPNLAGHLDASGPRRETQSQAHTKWEAIMQRARGWEECREAVGRGQLRLHAAADQPCQLLPSLQIVVLQQGSDRPPQRAQPPITRCPRACCCGRPTISGAVQPPRLHEIASS